MFKVYTMSVFDVEMTFDSGWLTLQREFDEKPSYAWFKLDDT